MQRLTISLDHGIAADFDNLLAAQGYGSRSEAIRDLIRRSVDARRVEEQIDGHCVANLSYVFDYRIRALAERLSEIQHEHHHLVLSSTRVVLDHDSSLETVILKGHTVAVRALADTIRAERGVRFAAINLIGVAPNDDHVHAGAHSHGHLAHASPHPG